MTQTVKISEFENFEGRELFGILTQSQIWNLLYHIKTAHAQEMFEAMGEDMILEQAEIIKGSL